MQKLSGYALNKDHSDGQHKAIVFEAALGITVDHAELLRDALLQAVQTDDAILGEKDNFGQRYRIDFEMRGVNGNTATIRSGWIVRLEENFPRLATVFVLEE